ncbi:MAG: LptA/OstA family protein [Steroidobacteraceae bacterium]
MVTLRLNLLLIAIGSCCAAGASDSARMQMGGWQLDASKINGSYQPNHVVVFDAVLTQGMDTIHADKAEAAALDVKDATWYLTGNVQVQVPQGDLMADSATVTFREGKVVMATAHGNPATFMQRTVPGTPPASGHAKDIAFDVPKGEVKLNGDAFVTREHNDLTACQIIYNITQQTVDAQKCENAEEGVHGTIELKSTAPSSSSGGTK